MTKVARAFLVGHRHGQVNGDIKRLIEEPPLSSLQIFLTVLYQWDIITKFIITLSNSQKEKPKSKSKGKPEKTKKKAKKESDEESGDEEEESEEEDADISGGSDSDWNCERDCERDWIRELHPTKCTRALLCKQHSSEALWSHDLKASFTCLRAVTLRDN